MAAGPFSDGRSVAVGGFLVTPPPPHTYDACYFWLSWYGTHGVDGLARLLAAQGAADDPDGFVEVAATVEAATGAPVADDLVRFAAAALTGRGYAWGPGAGAGPTLDWAEHLDRWTPPPLAPGEPARATLGGGGALAREVVAPGAILVDPPGLTVALVAEDGSTRLLDPGERVAPEGAGRAWVVVVRPEAGGVEAALALGA